MIRTDNPIRALIPCVNSVHVRFPDLLDVQITPANRFRFIHTSQEAPASLKASCASKEVITLELFLLLIESVDKGYFLHEFSLKTSLIC